MSAILKVSLRSGESIFINGALVRVDRNVRLELLNNAQFLLEQHILPPCEMITPLGHLYGIIQSMLTDPGTADAGRRRFERAVADLREHCGDPVLSAGLERVEHLVSIARLFDALKTMRHLLQHERPAGSPQKSQD